MISVRIYRNRKFEYVPLEVMVNMYHKFAPTGWFQDVEEIVDRAMGLSTSIDAEEYFKKYAFKTFDYKEVKLFYETLKNSKYNKILADDILKYIAYINACGFFKIINYDLDINAPNIDDWLNSKNPFHFFYTEEELKHSYSMMDLLPIENGMNAIRSEMLKANKKIF